MLLWAALIGVIGGLATVTFHEGMAFTESVVTGRPGSLVAAAESLAPWRRWITPALGGIAAGAFLWWARHLAHGKKQSDYLEAIVVVSSRHHARAADVLPDRVRDDAGVSIGAGAHAGLPRRLPRLARDPTRVDLPRRPASRDCDRGRSLPGAR